MKKTNLIHNKIRLNYFFLKKSFKKNIGKDYIINSISM